MNLVIEGKNHAQRCNNCSHVFYKNINTAIKPTLTVKAIIGGNNCRVTTRSPTRLQVQGARTSLDKDCMCEGLRFFPTNIVQKYLVNSLYDKLKLHLHSRVMMVFNANK